MPNMNGPVACTKIRQLGYRGIIVGLTGNALPVDVQEYMASGADEVLIKPLSAALLYSSLETIRRGRSNDDGQNNNTGDLLSGDLAVSMQGDDPGLEDTALPLFQAHSVQTMRISI